MELRTLSVAARVLVTAVLVARTAAAQQSVTEREYVIAPGQCVTIDLAQVCDDDGGVGCEFIASMYRTNSQEVRGYRIDVRMQSPTLQPVAAPGRQITTGNSFYPVYKRATLGKDDEGTQIFNPWRLLFVQNNPVGCPATYVAPKQFGAANSNKAYESTTLLTARAATTHTAVLVIKKN